MTTEMISQIPGLTVLQPVSQFPPYTALSNVFGEYHHIYGYVKATLPELALAGLISVFLLICAGIAVALLFNRAEKKQGIRYVMVGIYMVLILSLALFIPLVLVPIVLVFGCIIPVGAYKFFKRMDTLRDDEEGVIEG